MKNNEKDINLPTDMLTDDQVKEIGEVLQKAGEPGSNAEFLEMDGEPNNADIPDAEVMCDDSITPGIADDVNEQLRSLGLDEDVINDLKDVEVDPSTIKEVEPDNQDYINAVSSYVGISDHDSIKLLEVIANYRNNPNGKYYDELPESVKKEVATFAISTNGQKVNKDNATKFMLDTFIHDAQFEKLVNEYQSSIADTMNEMHKDFQGIIQQSFDDLFYNIDKLKEANPEQAENLSKFHDAFKSATTFEKQLAYLDGGLSKRKLDKWYSRYNNECFYFNKRINTEANTSRGIKFAPIQDLVPTIKRALDGFTQTQIEKFIIVFIRSLDGEDLEDVANLFYVYGVISAIDSFKYNTNFDSELAQTLFGNITKVIQKIIAL